MIYCTICARKLLVTTNLSSVKLERKLERANYSPVTSYAIKHLFKFIILFDKVYLSSGSPNNKYPAPMPVYNKRKLTIGEGTTFNIY